MQQARNFTDFNTLQQYTTCLESAYQDLFKKYHKILNEQELSKQEWLDSSLKDQLSRLQKKFFGFGREELQNREKRPVGHKQEELNLHGKRLQTEENKEEISSTKESLCAPESDIQKPPEAVYYELNERDFEMENKLRGLSSTSDNWQKMKNFHQDSVEITINERVYKKVVHRQAKYRLKDEFNTTGKEVIITAPGPAKLKPGCTYSIDFALAVVSDKYEFHLPLERQRRKMEAAGLDVDVKTLYSLCQTVAEHCESSVVSRIRDDIFNDFCAVHLDESPWPIIGEDSNGYMWAASNRIGSYYRYEPSRSGKIALEILNGYQGSVLTDGFAGYNRLKRLLEYRLGHCWSHVRREFYERQDSYPKETEEILSLIQKLFAVEAKAKTFDELRQLRKTESKQITDEIYKWLIQTKGRFLSSEGISSAINYTLKLWNELTLFLRDLSVPLSNNDAERALRHIVLGRKNFSGSRTINGADVAATLYTVIESSKKVGLQPKEYMKHVISERWHGRVPKTPAEMSLEKIGRNKTIVFPPKHEWQI